MEQIYYKKFLQGMKQIHGIGSGDMYIEYKLNEFIYPKNRQSGLFVFDTLVNARNYMYGCEIFACKVINPRKIDNILDMGAISCIHKYVTTYGKLCKNFWNGINCDLTTDAPKGTIVCDALMLLEQVYPEIV